MRLSSIIVAIALVGAATCAGTASAATVSVSGATLSYQATAGETNSPSIARESSDLVVTDFQTTITPGSGCVNTSNPYSVGHVILCAAAGISHLYVDTGDLSDHVSVSSSVGAAVDDNISTGTGDDSVDDQSGGASVVDAGTGDDSVSTYGGVDTIHGGTGKDDLNGGDGNDTVYGDAGDDTLWGGSDDDAIYGGDGKDSIYGMDGDDTLHGDIGDDDLRGNAGTDTIYGDAGDDSMADDGPYGDAYVGDVLSGGPGTDTADYSYRSSSWDPVTITLDDTANDGADGENDQVGVAGDVENVSTGWGDDTVVGNDGPNVITTDFGDDTIDGRGGDDKITSSFDDDVVHGGDGNDSINGNSGDDRLFGDGGNDQVYGDSGTDAIDPGAGVDTVDAGSDNDVVIAQDGEVDQIGCGVGADVAQVDYNDVVNADAGSNCESVTRTAAPAGAAGAGAGVAGGGATVPAGTAGAGNPNATLVAAILGSGSFKLASVAKSGALPVSLSAPGPGTFDVKAMMDAKAAKKAHLAAAKLVTIGHGVGAAAAAGDVKVKVALTSKARKRLRSVHKTLTVTLVTTFTPVSGSKSVVKKVVKLKR